MSGVIVCHLDAGVGFKRPAVVHRLKILRRIDGILYRIQRFRRFFQSSTTVFSGAPFRFHLLNMRTVLQHELQQFPRGRRAIDGIAETAAHHQRQQTGMIDMRMRHQDKINLLRTVHVRIEVALFNSLVPLVHTAIHGETRSAGLNHITGAGHRSGGAEKLYLHQKASVGIVSRA